MFKPLPMLRVELALLRDDAPRAALLLANYGSFDPEAGDAAQLPELPGERYSLAHAENQAWLDKILAHYGIAVPGNVAAPIQQVSQEQLDGLGVWLKEIWEKCSDGQERTRRLREEQRHTMQLLKALGQFMELNIDLTLLQQKSAFLDVRVGTLPRANISRFEEALGLAGYVAISFSMELEQAGLIIAGATGHASEIEDLLHNAGWRTMEVPPEFRGHPEEVRKELTERMVGLDAAHAAEEIRRQAEPRQDRLLERLLDAAHTLACAAPYAELSGLMRGRGSLAMVGGWIPQGRLARLQEMLQQNFGNAFLLRTREPRAEEYPQVPSVICHHPWLQPFAKLVLDYGVPRYGEIDPTVLFAVSFVLMFGMMFGDVGQGACLALGGVLLRRRFRQYAPLAVAVGISSAFFGLLYGSVFGFEHILPALWVAPLSDPLRMLGVALGWGMGFIALATALTIRNRIAAGRMRDALLDSHGAAGLLLYFGLLLGAYRIAGTGRLDTGILLIVCAALAAIFTHTWQHNNRAPFGERVLIVLMEGFEAVMAYISNTLSFLRLAAFSLNHVALAIAIFTVGSMLHITGYWLTVVLGNVFILVLEGAIVAIQALRLEYYEGFSRFFGGDGRAFQPLTLERVGGPVNCPDT